MHLHYREQELRNNTGRSASATNDVLPRENPRDLAVRQRRQRARKAKDLSTLLSYYHSSQTEQQSGGFLLQNGPHDVVLDRCKSKNNKTTNY